MGREGLGLLQESLDQLAAQKIGHLTPLPSMELGIDPVELRSRADQPDVQSRLPVLREMVGDCQLLLRIDRTELSKNIVRGLEAYRELLRTRPQWREQVVHLAFAYPSRQDLAVYRDYTAEVSRVAAARGDTAEQARTLDKMFELAGTAYAIPSHVVQRMETLALTFVLLARAWDVLLAPFPISTAVRINLFSATMSALAHVFWFLLAHRILAFQDLYDHRA